MTIKTDYNKVYDLYTITAFDGQIKHDKNISIAKDIDGVWTINFGQIDISDSVLMDVYLDMLKQANDLLKTLSN